MGLVPRFVPVVLACCAAPAAYAPHSSFYGYVDEPVVADEALFVRELDPYGRWVESARYGFVWLPHLSAVGVGWQPYTRGRWHLTEAGWTWDSELPFGFIVFHYGRWVHESPHGWVWVPDYEWGPAWVRWRTGPEYVGWAPLGPGGVFFDSWVYVHVVHFHSPNLVIIRDPATVIVCERSTSYAPHGEGKYGPNPHSVGDAASRGPPVKSLEDIDARWAEILGPRGGRRESPARNRAPSTRAPESGGAARRDDDARSARPREPQAPVSLPHPSERRPPAAAARPAPPRPPAATARPTPPRPPPQARPSPQPPERRERPAPPPRAVAPKRSSPAPRHFTPPSSSRDDEERERRSPRKPAESKGARRR